MYLTEYKVDCGDYQLHQSVCRFFSQDIEKGGRNFCYKRIGSGVVIFSDRSIAQHSIKNTIYKQGYRFSIEFTPNRKTYRDENGKRKRHKNTMNGNDAANWLFNRFEGCAKLSDVKCKQLSPHKIEKPCGNNAMIFARYTASGLITITNAQATEAKIVKGIGQGGAFGMGAMILEST